MSLRDQLIGCWKLESYTEQPIDGTPAVHPFGEQAKGMIIYTLEGFMSVQMMPSGRPAFASGDWFRGTPEEYEKAANYIAYAGPFQVNEEAKTVSHGNIFVSFFPNWLGQTQVRAAKLELDCLQLEPTAPIQSGGKEVIPRLIWRRASPEAARPDV